MEERPRWEKVCVTKWESAPSAREEPRHSTGQTAALREAGEEHALRRSRAWDKPGQEAVTPASRRRTRCCVRACRGR